MTTIKKIIERVDRKINNAYNDETKLEWIASLDGKIAMDVMLMDIKELPQFNYSFPEDLDTEPLVKFPYDDLYDRWIAAMIAAQDEEWERYANAMEYYNAFYEEFVNWFLSTYRPGQGSMGDGGYKPGLPSYYITAYGLACMKGFSGTLEEWFSSLRGEKGDKGDPGMKLAGVFVEMLDEGKEPYANITGTDNAPILNLGIPKQLGDYLPVGGGKMEGAIDMAGFGIGALPDPVNDSDAATKKFVEDELENARSDDEPKVAGEASAGIADTVSRSDHVHPAQESVTGNAGTATKLKTPRWFRTHLDSTASAQFDGTADAPIGVTGVLGGTNGGTGINLSNVPAFAILRRHGNDGDLCHYTPTSNGAFYATTSNGTPQFGTLPIAQGGTGATTAATALSKLGALPKSGGTMTGTLNVPTPLDVVGTAYPTYALKKAADGDELATMTLGVASRILLFQVYNADMDGKTPRYKEMYLLPAPSVGLTEDKRYHILTNKDPADSRDKLGLGSKRLYNGTLRWDTDKKSTTFPLSGGNLFVIVGRPQAGNSLCSVVVPKEAITTENVRWQFVDNQGYVAFNLKYEGDTVTLTLAGATLGSAQIVAVYGVF